MDPLQIVLMNQRRNMDVRYAIAEFIWYMARTSDTTWLQRFAPQYKNFTEDGVNAHGAYGLRFHYPDEGWDQLNLCIETLKRNIDSRQAIISMWDKHDLKYAVDTSKKDLPCTQGLQFLCREGKLHMVVTMRSNDIWLGFPYDVFCFAMIQRIIAEELGSMLGYIYWRVGSMHLYEKHQAAAHDAQYQTPERWRMDAKYRLTNAKATELGIAGPTEPTHVYQNPVADTFHLIVNSEADHLETLKSCLLSKEPILSAKRP